MQVFPQNSLGAPLRLAALKIVATAGIGKALTADFPQTGAQELKLPYVHTGAQKRLGEAAALQHLQYRRLENGTAGLAMRLELAIDDARRDAMAKKFAGGEQSARPRTDDQHARIDRTP